MQHTIQIFQSLIIVTMLTSCSNVLLKEYKHNELTINTQGDNYKSKKIISKEVNDFEIKASIEFKKSYRNNSSAWAGFFIKTDKFDGEHRKDSGYLCFVREDGEIGIHASPPPNREILKQTYDYPIGSNKKRNLIIKCKNSQIDFLVDDQLIYKIKNFKLNGNYISANCGSGIFSFKIDYVKAK